MSNYTLSDCPSDRNQYSKIIDETKNAILSSFSDDTSFSGIDPNELRKKIRSMSILEDEGLGFERTLSLVKEERRVSSLVLS